MAYLASDKASAMPVMDADTAGRAGGLSNEILSRHLSFRPCRRGHRVSIQLSDPGRNAMIERKGGSRARTSGVIVRSNRHGVFSDLVTPDGGSLKVMSREVYVKATQAARAAFMEGVVRKSDRDLSIGAMTSENKRTAEKHLTPIDIAGKPFKGV